MLQVGIVGLPNVGKSTLFNAILKRQQALAANYPFATIEPNIGTAEVIDERLQKLAQVVYNNTKVNPPIIYSTVEFVDIAGLVEGARKGEGLGNKFLANIREVDLILQVVRDFSDTNVIREHSKNPDTDTDIINSELILKDIETLQKKIDEKKKVLNKIEQQIYTKYITHLNKGGLAIDLRCTILEKEYNEFIKPLFLLTDKPIIYVFNVDENDVRIKTNSISDYKGKPCVYISAKIECELSSLSTEDQQIFLTDLGITENGLNKITNLCFSQLGLISYFTAGVKEIRAWEIPKGTKAVKASAKIHTDFEKNFIKAEVIAYNDYIKFGGKLGAKENGKLKLEGKEYIVNDGDVIEFRIGQ